MNRDFVTPFGTIEVRVSDALPEGCAMLVAPGQPKTELEKALETEEERLADLKRRVVVVKNLDA